VTSTVATTAELWLRSLADAWQARDPDAAAALFTDDGTYSTHPFAPPRRGRAAIRAYWAGEVAGQRGIAVRFGVPVSSGDRVVAEWWATMRDESADPPASTLAGIVVLRFAADGRCAELREYWMGSFGATLEPQPGWGR